jgi:hypothetical protein
MEALPVLVHWWVWVAVVVVHSEGPADQGRPVVALEVTPLRLLEQRPKAFGGPMVRPTKGMLPAAAVVALVRWVLGGFIRPMVTAVSHLPLRVATEARESSTPFQEQQRTTVAAVAVEPTTTRFLRPRSVVMEVLGAVERVPVPIKAQALPERPIPAVVAVVATRKAWVARADLAW